MPVKINIGCGVHLVGRGWINVDRYFSLEQLKAKKGQFRQAIIEKGAKFVQADVTELPFPDNYADVIECHQVLEHVRFHLVPRAFKEIYRVLKPEGVFYADVPSMDGLALDWLNMSVFPELDLNYYHNVMETIYGNQYGETGDGETHRCAFNMKYLNWLLVQAGFKNGDLILAKKGSQIHKFGELVKGSKKKVYRYDNLLCEVKKPI